MLPFAVHNWILNLCQTYVSALLPWFSQHQAHSPSSFAKLKENKVKVLENCAFGTNRKDFLYLSLGI